MSIDEARESNLDKLRAMTQELLLRDAGVRTEHTVLKVAIQAADLGVWVWSLDDGRCDLDDRMREMFGSEGHLFEMCLNPHVNRIRKSIEEHPADPDYMYPVRFRVHVPGSTGDDVVVEARGQLCTEEGAERRIVGVCRVIDSCHPGCLVPDKPVAE